MESVDGSDSRIGSGNARLRACEKSTPTRLCASRPWIRWAERAVEPWCTQLSGLADHSAQRLLQTRRDQRLFLRSHVSQLRWGQPLRTVVGLAARARNAA